MRLSVGSLFSGIGGLELGLERTGGFVTKWQVECDDYCNRVLERHWPDVRRYRDVREVGAHNLEPVDLICGGFPCQPHSLAGKRKGKDDERNLWPEYLRIVDELRPTWVLGENVPGIRTTILDDILDDLEGLGYATRTFDIPACAVGAPHLRHRFFIVAHAKHKRPSLAGRRDEPVGAQCGVVNAGREDVAHAKGGQPRIATKGKRWEDSGGRSADCRGAAGEGSGTGCDDVAHADCPRCQEQRRAEPVEAQQRSVECGGAEMADAESKYGEWPKPGGDRRWQPEGAAGNGGCDKRNDADADCEPLGRPTEPRRECGQWEVEPNVGRVANGVPSRVDRLRCLGNAVVPQVAEYIGRMIVDANEGMKI